MQPFFNSWLFRRNRETCDALLYKHDWKELKGIRIGAISRIAALRNVVALQLLSLDRLLAIVCSAMSSPSLVPGALWHQMLPALQRLPLGPIGRERLLTEDFKLADEGRLSVYWIPFGRLNVQARVVICGLTPGYGQMLQAFAAAREALSAGLGLDETLAHVDRVGSFAGTMRNNMVGMLDDPGMAEALEIPSTAALFAEADHYVHTTSALRYPVFVDGQNYGGANPQVRQSALLQKYVTGTLGPELAAVPDALIVPLGKAAESCVQMLVSAEQLDMERCLFGFPHPSGGNGHRVRQFRENHERLRQELDHWANRYPSRL